ncbi:MAG: GDSL-type esterase/lipase family protein [Acetobacteraceae bacterium]
MRTVLYALLLACALRLGGPGGPATARRSLRAPRCRPKRPPTELTDPTWRKQVAELDSRLPSLQRESRRLVFIGDSLTASWDPGLFSQFYGSRAPLLLGISGDYTQGVLQRLPNEWGPLRPRLVVLLIGTNNTWGEIPAGGCGARGRRDRAADPSPLLGNAGADPRPAAAWAGAVGLVAQRERAGEHADRALCGRADDLLPGHRPVSAQCERSAVGGNLVRQACT